MTDLLNKSKEITTAQYCSLPNTPEFMGQTRVDDNNMYWMVFSSLGILYKIHSKL